MVALIAGDGRGRETPNPSAFELNVFPDVDGSWHLVDKQFVYNGESISYYAACPLNGWGHKSISG
jgi:hypothetical protein